MIARGRPKIYSPDLCSQESDLKSDPSELFFSSGRSAMSFALKQYAIQKDMQLVVAVQDFNCVAVMEAVIQSGNRVILLDIERFGFSVSLSEIENLKKIPDVLVLTHYQGIPNPEYKSIADYCKQKSILLIDDLAQSHGSSIGGFQLGSLCDIKVHSFAFDKPFTSLFGGSLAFVNCSDSLSEQIRNAYKSIPEESENNAHRDLLALEALWLITDTKRFKSGIDNLRLIRALTMVSSDAGSIISLASAALIKVVGKFLKLKKANAFKIQKLHASKVQCIKNQRNAYKYDIALVENLVEQIAAFDVIWPNLANIDIHWNRISVLDESRVLSKALAHAGVQAGNFNWPATLSSQYMNHPKVDIAGSLVNSKYCSEYVVNIPCWTHFKLHYPR